MRPRGEHKYTPRNERLKDALKTSSTHTIRVGPIVHCKTWVTRAPISLHSCRCQYRTVPPEVTLDHLQTERCQYRAMLPDVAQNHLHHTSGPHQYLHAVAMLVRRPSVRGQLTKSKVNVSALDELQGCKANLNQGGHADLPSSQNRLAPLFHQGQGHFRSRAAGEPTARCHAP